MTRETRSRPSHQPPPSARFGLPLRHRFLLPALATACLLSACARQKPEPVPPPAPAPAPATGEKRFPLTGQIISIDRQRGMLVVDHAEIPGYMPAMVMEFSVLPGDLANATEGRRLRAEMVEMETPSGEDAPAFRLEKVWFIDSETDTQVATATSSLRRDTAIRGRNVYREIGENLPGFILYNQKAEPVSASQFRGRHVVINFIYTRCPVATMCPASTLQMKTLQAKAREAGINDLSLISISLDPEYDTPGVLRDYAEAYGIDTSNFSLLTGPERAIKDLLNQFGVLIDGRDGPLLKHTLSTLLIDPQGRIAWRADGTRWSADDFVERMQGNEK